MRAGTTMGVLAAWVAAVACSESHHSPAEQQTGTEPTGGSATSTLGSGQGGSSVVATGGGVGGTNVPGSSTAGGIGGTSAVPTGGGSAGATPGAGCTTDADCGPDLSWLFCVERRCVWLPPPEGGKCDVNCGIPRGEKPPPFSCNPCFACIDGRCRLCQSDDECWPYLCNSSTGVCEQIQLDDDAGSDPAPCSTDDDCGPVPTNPAWERFCNLGYCEPVSYYFLALELGSSCPKQGFMCGREDCCFPLACVDGRCRNCEQDAQCGTGETCLDGACVMP